MQQYMLAVHGNDDDPMPAEEDMQRMFAQVDAFNQEVMAAGAWVFGGGLLPASSATVVRAHEGDVTLTDGPYVETKEHLGGFWVIQAADLDAALAWSKKACRRARGPSRCAPSRPSPEPRRP